ncbi:MAG: dihydrodipicolinate synthase family protein [Bacillales bacterium]|nr:dihydrodipicolinate synthase family protein [Bacillales bacterium]
MQKSLIHSLITPFDENGKIDYQVLEQILNLVKDNYNDGVILFSLVGEGNFLSLEEKKEIYNFIKKRTDITLYYSLNHLSFKDAFKEIESIKELGIQNYVVTCPYFVKPTQDGIFLYYKKIAKALFPSKVIIHNIPSRTGVNITFQTIRRLYKSLANINGLIESSSDLNLIAMIKKDNPNMKIFLGEEKLFLEALEKNIDGIVSSISMNFGKQYKEIMEDMDIGFKNELLISYLRLVLEIISEYDYPMNIKYYLSKKGFKSMELRLPLTKITLDNEDYNLLL